jgi:hypothetical protein
MVYCALESFLIDTVCRASLYASNSLHPRVEFSPALVENVVARLLHFIQSDGEEVVQAECCSLLEKIVRRGNHIPAFTNPQLHQSLKRCLCTNNVMLIDRCTSLLAQLVIYRKW